MGLEQKRPALHSHLGTAVMPELYRDEGGAGRMFVAPARSAPDIGFRPAPRWFTGCTEPRIGEKRSRQDHSLRLSLSLSLERGLNNHRTRAAKTIAYFVGLNDAAILAPSWVASSVAAFN